MAVWNIYIARFYTDSPEIYGQYLLMLSQAAIWLILADSSLNAATQQILIGSPTSDRKINEHLAVVLILRFFLGIISAIGFFCTIYFEFSESAIPAFLLSLNLIVFALGSAPLGAWSAHQEFRVESKYFFLMAFSFILPAFLLTLYTNNIVAIIVCNLFGTLVGGCYVWIKTILNWNISFPGWTNLRQWILRYVAISTPITISAFVFTLYFRGDVMYIASKIGSTAAGIFAISLFLFMLVLDVSWGQFGKAYSPRMIELWKAGDAEGGKISKEINYILDIYGVLVVLILVGGWLLGKETFSLIFGDNSPWVYSLSPLLWLISGLLAVIVFSFLSRFILLENGIFYFLAVAAIIFTAKFLFFYFISSLSLPEIGFLSCMGMILFCIGLSLMLDTRGRRIFFNLPMLGRLLLPLCIMGGLFQLDSYNPISLVESCLLSVTIFLITLYVNKAGFIKLTYSLLSKASRTFKN